MTEPRLRPVVDGDRAFLVDLYASVREPELAHIPWDETLKRAFVEQQFAAQDGHYREHYPGATLDVIEVDGEPAGRLYVHRGPSEIRIMDIALAPEFRGRGLGAQLIRALLAEADAAGKRVTVHVERFNPALRLYRRLGFAEVEDRGVYLFLERSPRVAT